MYYICKRAQFIQLLTQWFKVTDIVSKWLPAHFSYSKNLYVPLIWEAQTLVMSRAGAATANRREQARRRGSSSMASWEKPGHGKLPLWGRAVSLGHGALWPLYSELEIPVWCVRWVGISPVAFIITSNWVVISSPKWFSVLASLVKRTNHAR